jgi:filamentous hemagglutinin family protein
VACPSGVEDGLKSSLPAGSTVVSVDPKLVSGLATDPQLTSNDVATCAFKITSNNRTVVELYFFEMDDAAAAVITGQLQSDGFTANPSTVVTGGTRQIFTKGANAVVLEKVTIGTLSAVIVAG